MPSITCPRCLKRGAEGLGGGDGRVCASFHHRIRRGMAITGDSLPQALLQATGPSSPTRADAAVSTPAKLLVMHLAELGLEATQEVRFHHTRKWRFDVACEAERIGFEIEGGAWIRGRHTRGKGFIADLEKYNTATLMGWRVLRFTPEQVLKGQAKEFVSQFLVLEAKVAKFQPNQQKGSRTKPSTSKECSESAAQCTSGQFQGNRLASG